MVEWDCLEISRMALVRVLRRKLSNKRFSLTSLEVSIERLQKELRDKTIYYNDVEQSILSGETTDGQLLEILKELDHR